MTPLQHQLKKLKKAPAQTLSIERDHSSLFFNKNEADRKYFYKITKKKFLMNTDLNYSGDVFKYEADEFNRRIEAMIIRLSLYLHHHLQTSIGVVYQYQVLPTLHNFLENLRF